MARLLYTGASDHTAIVKRFEDEEIEAALASGWRLRRVNPGEAEAEEPGSDGKLRQDGPTLEEYVKAGYPADTTYPPSGYAEKPSDGLTALRAQAAEAPAAEAPQDAPDSEPEAVDPDIAEAEAADLEQLSAPDSTDPPADQRPEDPEPPTTSRRRRR